MTPNIGAPAPDFSLKDQDQKEVKLSDFRGKKPVVLVFYPLDWSPTCTKEHACMVNDKKQFEESERASPRHQRRQRMVPQSLRG